MKTKLLLVFACGLAAVCAAQAADAAKPAAQVKVTFVTPDKFTDIKDGFMDSERDHEYLLGELKAQMVTLAAKYLGAGQSLEIKVTDVDLAGDFEPWRGIDFDHVRIVKDIYPPRMNLEFRLLDANGTVVSEGKRRLQNLGFLMTLGMPPNDPLRYDKEMIRDWMRQEFYQRAS
ncbi:MAG: DUF3016 domain-containing protein [Lacunisphaera sp.]|nr:DUF3016 domain-containing protein [Lacunisphaera sp.]